MNEITFVELSNGDTAVFLNGITVQSLDADEAAPSGYTPLVVAKGLGEALGCEVKEVRLQTPDDSDWSWEGIYALIPRESAARGALQNISVASYLTGVRSVNCGGGSWVDLLHMKDGRLIGLNGECVCVYASLQAFEAIDGLDAPQHHMWIKKPAQATASTEASEEPIGASTTSAQTDYGCETMASTLRNYPLFDDLDLDGRILQMRVTDGCAVDCIAVLESGHQLAQLCPDALPKLLDVVKHQINVFYFG